MLFLGKKTIPGELAIIVQCVKDYKRRYEVLQRKRPAISISHGAEGYRCQEEGVWDLADKVGHVVL